MARHARPRFHKARRRWFACIGGFSRDGRRREVFAPRSIGPGDEASAWAWFTAEVARRGPDWPFPYPPPAGPGFPTREQWLASGRARRGVD